MNADRESNRLPLRAGAMLLLAVAIVFGALGIHSLATADDNAEDDLRAAQPSVTSTTAPPPTSAATTARICVINAGNISGLADEVDTKLRDKGFTTQGINANSNYSAGGFSDNSIVYSTAAQKAQAEKINQALDGDYDVDSRSSLGGGFSRCQGGIAVVVVTR